MEGGEERTPRPQVVGILGLPVLGRHFPVRVHDIPSGDRQGTWVLIHSRQSDDRADLHMCPAFLPCGRLFLGQDRLAWSVHGWAFALSRRWLRHLDQRGESESEVLRVFQ